MPPRLGIHLFGDYLLPRWQSQFANPWLNSDPAYGPLTNYLPFAVGVFWIFSNFEYWRSFVAFALLPLVGTIVVLWRALQGEDRVERARFIFSSVVLTAPFIALLDRGNIQLYVVWFCCLGTHLFIRGRPFAGAVSLGFAIALKGYPIFFLALWIKAKKWSEAAAALVTAGFVSLVPLLLYEGGVIGNLRRLFNNVRFFGNQYASESIAYNNSLRGTFLTLSQIAPWGLDAVARTFYDNFVVVTAIVVVVGVGLMLQSTVDDVGRVLIAAALMTSLIDFSAGYALTVFFVVITTLPHLSANLTRVQCRTLCVLLAIHMMPRGIPLKFWSQEPLGNVATYSSVLGGTVSMLIIAVVAWSALRARWARGDLNPHVLANTGT